MTEPTTTMTAVKTKTVTRTQMAVALACLGVSMVAAAGISLAGGTSTTCFSNAKINTELTIGQGELVSACRGQLIVPTPKFSQLLVRSYNDNTLTLLVDKKYVSFKLGNGYKKVGKSIGEVPGYQQNLYVEYEGIVDKKADIVLFYGLPQEAKGVYCTDTDESQQNYDGSSIKDFIFVNPYVKGISSYYDAEIDEMVEVEDSCIIYDYGYYGSEAASTTNNLQEGYCSTADGGKWFSKVITCEGGCEDGACVYVAPPKVGTMGMVSGGKLVTNKLVAGENEVAKLSFTATNEDVVVKQLVFTFDPGGTDFKPGQIQGVVLKDSQGVVVAGPELVQQYGTKYQVILLKPKYSEFWVSSSINTPQNYSLYATVIDSTLLNDPTSGFRVSINPTTDVEAVGSKTSSTIKPIGTKTLAWQTMYGTEQSEGGTTTTTPGNVGVLIFDFDTHAYPTSTKLVYAGANSNNKEEILSTMSVKAKNEDVLINKMVFKFSDNVNSDLTNAFSANGLRLYVKQDNGFELLVGTGSLVSSQSVGLSSTDYATVINTESNNLVVSSTKNNILVLKGVFNGTNEGLVSGISPNVGLGNGVDSEDIKFVDAKGVSSGVTLTGDHIATTKSDALWSYSSPVVVYRSYPKFTYVNPGQTLVNGAENDIFKFKVRANGESIALKQLQFSADVVDNVGSINNLSLKEFKLYQGNIDLTNKVLITKSNGLSLRYGVSDLKTGLDQYFYITWIKDYTTGMEEEVIPGGAEYEYTIKATLGGFNNDADNDYIRVHLNNLDTEQLDDVNKTYYLTQMSSAMPSIWFVTLCDSKKNLVVKNGFFPPSIIWSDKSAIAHSSATSTFSGPVASSGDWFNGYLVKDAPTKYSTLIK